MPWTPRKDGLALRVRLTPKSSRDSIDGIERLPDGHAALRVRVRAVPEADAANDALIRIIARALARPISAIRVESGATSRLKCLRIAGDPAELAGRLAALCRPNEG